MGKHKGPVLVYHAVKSQRISDTLWVWTTITIKPPNLGTYLSICNMMESTTTAEQQNIDCSKWGLYLNTTVVDTEIKKSSCLPLEDLRRTGISTKIVLSPLPTLKWGLGRGVSWLHPFWSLRYTACIWASLAWPCLPTRCSVTGSSHDLAFPPYCLSLECYTVRCAYREPFCYLFYGIRIHKQSLGWILAMKIHLAV